uniref:Motile sperm domain containing 3 n=1 Tax=Molossus molossus TaxID=27622 RepID=A0A7J8J1E8_MOLMO|nr:motile sperm domain containing 3 [Molossus molossus]
MNSAASCPKSCMSRWDKSWLQPTSWASSPWSSSRPEPPAQPQRPSPSRDVDRKQPL